MKQQIVAPCGIDCFNCEVYEDNVTDKIKERVHLSTKIPKEMISCKGCHDRNQCVFLDIQRKKCKTLECVEKKGVSYCFECADFPCEMLMPLADRAGAFPQNIKAYNLCLMKRIGVEAWCKQAKQIRTTYFTQKLNIGEGGSK